MLMIPAMIPFVLLSLACLSFIVFFPINVAFFGPYAITKKDCIPFETSSDFDTCIEYDGVNSKAAAMLIVWIVICVITCTYQINKKNVIILLSNLENEYSYFFLFITIYRYCQVCDHRFIFSLQVCGRRLPKKSLTFVNHILKYGCMHLRMRIANFLFSFQFSIYQIILFY